MKRIIIFIIISAFSLLGFMVEAKAVTFDEIANKYKEKYDWSKIDQTMAMLFSALEDGSKVVTTNNKIEVTTQYEGKNLTTTFNYQNGLITYNLAGADEYNENTFIASFVDSAFITKLLYVISELKGSTPDEITNYYSSADETDFTLAKHGLEIEKYEYKSNAEGDSSSMSGIKSMKIDIDKFNLKGNSTTNIENNESKDNLNNPSIPIDSSSDNEVENPKTGYDECILISAIILLIGGLLVNKFKRKSLFRKI